MIEPEPTVLDVEDDECFQRLGLGTPDVASTVTQLQQRGVEFLAAKSKEAQARGALTRTVMGSVMFELVHDERA
jgi:4-hydroxyphenylpyruvate dioxygenase